MEAREKRVYRAAKMAYDEIDKTIAAQGLDEGEGIAVCKLLAGWLSGNADAKRILTLRSLADSLYAGTRRGTTSEQS